MLEVTVKSTSSDRRVVTPPGDSDRTMPPGPLGTLRKDFPRKRMVVGIPVIQVAVRSSRAAAAEASPPLPPFTAFSLPARFHIHAILLSLN